MKILQMIPAFYPAVAYGGTVNVAYHLSKELARRGHEVTVYSSDALDKNHRQKGRVSEIDGIKVHYFTNLSNRLAWHRLVFTPGMCLQLSKEIKKFDIIHLHGSRNFQNIVAHHYAKKYNIPYVLQAHGSVLPIIQKQQLKKIFDLIFGYRILKGASKAIAVAKTEVEQYKKMGVDEDKIDIVPNGIELSEYENLPERGEFRRKYSIRDNEKIVLYLGRLHKTKGIELLVKSFSDLLKELDNVRLVLVGPDDGYRLTLEEIIQALKMDNKVLFTGFVSNDEKRAAFVDADVFVNPSADEIFGLVFLEANACGTPVIGSKGCGIANVIDGKTGFAVRTDKNQLRDAIFKILSDEGMRRRFGKEGKKLVREKFGWDNIVEEVEKIYLGLIER